TRQIDGLPQRVVRNELVDELEGASGLRLLARAFRSALAFRKVSGASLAELVRSGLAMRRNQRLTRAQLPMAAGAPVPARNAMLDGDPVHGYLPSGTVAGVIGDRPTCAELIDRIEAEAEETLRRLTG